MGGYTDYVLLKLMEQDEWVVTLIMSVETYGTGNSNVYFIMGKFCPKDKKLH